MYKTRNQVKREEHQNTNIHVNDQSPTLENRKSLTAPQRLDSSIQEYGEQAPSNLSKNLTM